MAITLAQLAITTGDKVKKAAIQSLLKEYLLLSMLTFDDSVTANKDAALNYVYSRVSKEAEAGYRDINTDFEDSEAELKQVVAKLKPIGGRYGIDSAVAGQNNAKTIVEFQQSQQLKSTIKALFDALINAKSSTNGFDGVKTLLGTADFKDQVIETTLDLSGSLNEATSEDLLMLLDELVMKAKLKDGNGIIVANSKALLKIKAAARKAGYYTRSENAFGVTVETYNGVALIDLGSLAGKDIVGVDDVTGETQIYGIRLAMDATHPAAVYGEDGIFRITPPNFKIAVAAGKEVAYGSTQIVTAFAYETTDCVAGIKGLIV